jgi:hypothetical protein
MPLTDMERLEWEILRLFNVARDNPQIILRGLLRKLVLGTCTMRHSIHLVVFLSA